MTHPVLVTRDRSKNIATLTFNRPEKYNAINEALAAAFLHGVQDIAADTSLRCVVLRGAGQAFLAGGDIDAFADNPDQADLTLQRILRHMHPALLLLAQLPVPVIAAVHGPAAGAGLSIVLAADYAICSRSASFVFAYDRLAALPDCGGSFYLRQKLGPRQAFALMLKSAKLTADEAEALGIVNQVCEDTTFESALCALTAHIASGPTKAFGLFKRLLASDLPLAAQLEAEKASFMEATYSEDFRMAICNFRTKTPNRFSGR
jgi:2-(1,2-epoxy-1,2-dihydrophenyl)acetyl-CoA isomerase